MKSSGNRVAFATVRRAPQPSNRGRAALQWTLVAVLGCATVGCQRQLMPTPNLYAYGHENPYDRVPAVYQNNLVDVLYVTDRVPSGERETGPEYGYGRSPSLAFGSCMVEIGQDVAWPDLVRASQTSKRDLSLPLAVKQVREIGRYPDVPYPVAEKGPRPVDDPVVRAQHDQVDAALHRELAERLARTERKHVYVYIHGFNNGFDDAVFTSAELWHFLGRQGVPLCYTWPAGRGLSSGGYIYDTVSCDFTVFHLKQLLRSLGNCPEVEKVHIVAHSRGTEVTTAALRELHLEYRHFERTGRDVLKLGNVVLAAPDLDFDVVQQRLGGERVGYLSEKLTIYTSPGDRALAFADILTLGVARLGQLNASAIPPRLRQLLEKLPVNFVEAFVKTDLLGHSYFVDSPAVSSDLILFLRDGREAGAAHGRPLKELATNLYEIRDDYLTK